MPPQSLPAGAKKIYNAAEASALKGTCDGDKSCAARVAWAAVKKKYKKKGNSWVRKSLAEVLKIAQETPRGPKFSRAEVGYLEQGGLYSNVQCGQCSNFIHGGSCRIVEGIIDPVDVCVLFDPITVGGSMPTDFAKAAVSASMFITKASQDPDSGERRWAAVASDTDRDSLGTRMSLSLFNDFIDRVRNNVPVPEVFTSRAWPGGMPYLSVAHYSDLDGIGIAGDPNPLEDGGLYVDGNRLKSKGAFRDNEVGEAAFQAIRSDIKDDVPQDKRIRISIGFVDWQHTHNPDTDDAYTFVRQSLSDVCPQCEEGIDGKVFEKGQLIHLALTRVPINERTPVWIEERSMPTPLRRDDAAAVLGDEELANKLELASRKRKKSRKYRSAIVEFSEAAEESEDPEVVRAFNGAVTLDDAEQFLIQQEQMSEVLDMWYLAEGVLYNILNSPEVDNRPEAAANVIRALAERADDTVNRSLAIRAASLVLQSQQPKENVMPDDNIDQVPETPGQEATPAPAHQPQPAPQPTHRSALDQAYENLRAAVEASRTSGQPTQQRLASVNSVLQEFGQVLRAEVAGPEAAQADVLAAAIGQALRQELAPLLNQVAANSARPATGPDEVPVPRSFAPASVPQESKPTSKITQMVNRSVDPSGRYLPNS